MIVLICSRIPNDFVDHLLVIQTCKSVDKIKYTMNTQQFWLLLGYLLKFVMQFWCLYKQLFPCLSLPSRECRCCCKFTNVLCR